MLNPLQYRLESRAGLQGVKLNKGDNIMINQKEYHENEIRNARKRFQDNEKISVIERREVLKTLQTDMDLEVLQERIDWLFAGNYGYGEMNLALQHIRKGQKSKRYNPNAALFILICNFEWLSPSNLTRKFWNSLDPRKQYEINKTIDNAVKSYETDQEEIAA